MNDKIDGETDLLGEEVVIQNMPSFSDELNRVLSEMKILFAGGQYPSGGISDFVMLGTEQECLTKYQQMAMMALESSRAKACEWGQIVDHATMEPEISLLFSRPSLFSKTGTIKIKRMIDNKVVESILLTISLIAPQ